MKIWQDLTLIMSPGSLSSQGCGLHNSCVARYVKDHEQFGGLVSPSRLKAKKRAWSSWWQQQRSREHRLLQACEAGLDKSPWAASLAASEEMRSSHLRQRP